MCCTDVRHTDYKYNEDDFISLFNLCLFHFVYLIGIITTVVSLAIQSHTILQYMFFGVVIVAHLFCFLCYVFVVFIFALCLVSIVAPEWTI
jgi:hypothetical protein